MMKIKRSDNAVSRTIDGEVVVLLPEAATIHALSGCGNRIWELIEEETTVSEIVQKIWEEYDVTLERAQEEITTFIDKLTAAKLVEIVVASKETSRRW
jgi:dissimilatory sulfite reductase (desulfoviridin) alpha/beta subunit